MPNGEILSMITSLKVKLSVVLLRSHQIYLSYWVSDIFTDHAETIKNNIKNLALKADDLDNYFADNFGCEMSIESKEDF